MKYQLSNDKKRTLVITLLSILGLSFCSQAVLAQTLKTRNHRISITYNCPEGYVQCDNVKYYGKNVKTGATIRLTGKTIHTICADGVTPCRFVGYVFRNGNYRYLVTEDGVLEVYQRQKLILQEQGNWTAKP